MSNSKEGMVLSVEVVGAGCEPSACSSALVSWITNSVREFFAAFAVVRWAPQGWAPQGWAPQGSMEAWAMLGKGVKAMDRVRVKVWDAGRVILGIQAGLH